MKQYNVKINAATGGKVTANTTACAPETEVILTAAPDAGYELDTLTVVNTATNASVVVSAVSLGKVGFIADMKIAVGDDHAAVRKSLARIFARCIAQLVHGR